jgi:hypothetical protein
MTYKDNMQMFFILALFLINGQMSKKRFDLQNFFGSKLGIFIKKKIFLVTLRSIAYTLRSLLYALICYLIYIPFYPRKNINSNCLLQFYLITNNEINATFLSRYIAKGLRYIHG